MGSSVQHLVAQAKSQISNLTAEGSDPFAPTVLYCASGGRSALATQTLQAMGYTDVAHLDGGLKAWTAQGRPVTPAP